jgi:hypothetical protein
MEKKWDTVTPADLKLEVYAPLVTKGLKSDVFKRVPKFSLWE